LIRDFKGDQWKEVGKVNEFDEMNPILLANNLLVPYLVACAEEYFRATYIALLKYSDKKPQILNSVRVSGDFLIQSFDSSHPLETAIASTLSCQNLSSICNHFKTLDAKLDIAGALHKPFRKRRVTLFESIQNLIEHRHSLIHRNDIRTSYTEENMNRDVADLEAAIKRVYKVIADRYDWIYDDSY